MSETTHATLTAPTLITIYRATDSEGALAREWCRTIADRQALTLEDWRTVEDAYHTQKAQFKVGTEWGVHRG